VIGGLISSTLLSLVFVPAVYVLMDDMGQGLWRRFSRLLGPVDEVPASQGSGEAHAAHPAPRPLAAE
ncbi:hypothetical protein ACSTH3_00070, partial [Vibrio parahaemolyticus]